MDRPGPAAVEPPGEPRTAAERVDGPRSFADLDSLEVAIVQAVAYSDIFDYPLTAAEIHRYLMEAPTTFDEVNRILTGGRLVPRFLSSSEGFYSIPGREEIVETRRQRSEQSREVWKRAFRFGRIIASLPFVRMVAVTGELAMDNVGPYSDIDYFIVTEPGRLWLTRLMVVAVVRCAGTRGPEICPNFLLSDQALELDDRNFYTAHEVAQMVPISGLETYRRLRGLNPWVEQYLPNAGGPPRHVEAPIHLRPLRGLAESLLRTPPGARLERWEMERKVRKLTDSYGPLPETVYSPDRCKGHVDGHGVRILSVFNERWKAVKVAMQ